MSKSRYSSRRIVALMGGASLLTLGLLAAPAFAQDAAATPDAAAPAPASADSTVVVVTGQRAQLRSAQKIKKDSDVIVDSVTAVDIGALPDRSVAEALQRISGVTIERAADAGDPIRMTAEAGGVEIRGLSWVRSELNGRDIFSAKDGRGLSWGDVSSDLLAGVDVYKNPSADMIEGGIGGTVNLRTRLPFDSKKQVIAFTIDNTRGDLQQKDHQSGSLLYSNQWDTSIGKIGALFNYSMVDEGNMTNVIAVDRYNPETTAGGQNVLVPNTMGWRTIEWNQKRTAAYAALQWRPNDAWEFTLTGLNAKAVPKNTEYNVGFYNDSGEFASPASMASYKYNSDGVFQSGTVKQAGITSNTRYGEDHNETSDIALHARWNASSRLTLSADLQYVRSTSNVLSNTDFMQVATKPDATIDISGKLPVISVSNEAVVADPSQYWWAAAMDHVEDNSGHELAARIDGDYDIDAGWLKDFKFGVRSTDKTYDTRQSGYNWNALSYQYWGSPGGGAAVYGTDTGASTYDVRDFSNFMNGAVPVPGTVVFPSAQTVNMGTAHTYDVLKSTETSGWGWTPLSTDYSTYAASGGLNHQREKTSAIYGLLKFGHDVSIAGQDRTIDGNVGIRYVQTKSTGASYIVMAAPTSTSAQCNTNCTEYLNYLAFASGGFTQPYSGGRNYSNTLPNFNIRLKWNDQLQFRFGASEGMVRPEMAWLNPYSSIGGSMNFTGTDGKTFDYATYTGTGGNPNLKPIEAAQYDWTGEWYFSPTGSLTMDLFYKKLKNYIYTGTSPETYTNNGQTLTFDVTRQENGNVDGTVKGYELAYQQFYDSLPAPLNGLGIQANYTHIDSSGGRNSSSTAGSALNALPLEGMSPNSYNFALMYEKYGISARLAYNWRSTYLYTTSAANVNRPLWAESYGQVDGSVFYTINDHYKVGVQITNLGHSTTTQLVSSDLDNPLVREWYSAIKTDKRISFVLRALY
ncbi:TonB-dependent receptor [Asticcacaulis sp. EMRT-3]|uniref:TonB-dependent receptor n=1 Tax=Asticcacaulis sp. EMRT-3 TaxID=3040349 RepID=UPI0024AFE139|nr:TonB-dependent receptor [Asticcacaulis sp. EMRT-3]MDI7776461.1 TonB-dependent receptor [Asticcacaulis sp. EMRT-3]